jgi:hypothetical protein
LIICLIALLFALLSRSVPLEFGNTLIHILSQHENHIPFIYSKCENNFHLYIIQLLVTHLCIRFIQHKLKFISFAHYHIKLQYNYRSHCDGNIEAAWAYRNMTHSYIIAEVPIFHSLCFLSRFHWYRDAANKNAHWPKGS